MKNPRDSLFLGIPLLVVLSALSLTTPWSEFGSLAKQILFPFLIAATCAAAFSGRIHLRLSLALAIVILVALSSALYSNGFAWRMDGEWNLVLFSFAIQAAVGLFGFIAAQLGLNAWKQSRGLPGEKESMASKADHLRAGG